MCMGKALAKPQIIKREDPSIKFVDGNEFDPKASPPEIDNTPVIKEKKNSQYCFNFLIYDTCLDSFHTY